MSANLSPDRQAFRDLLSTLAVKTQAKMPALNGRAEKACKLVLGGDVALSDDGIALVGSLSTPTVTYQVAPGLCQCKDFDHAPEHLCCHRLAVGFARKVQELLPQAPHGETDAPVCRPGSQTPPLPEAPVSITLKATFEGQEVPVTLRGTDFASVQAQVEQASAWLKAHAPSPTVDSTPPCPTHGTVKKSSKGKGYYCPHKLEDGTWCPYKGR